MYQLEPASVRALVQAYLDALDESGLGSRIYGIYLYGSIPLGGFDEHTSDIDVIALTHEDLAPAELAVLQAIHEHLEQEPAFSFLRKRLDVMYVPLRDLGKRNSEVAPYPYAAGGEFHPSGHFDLNGVASITGLRPTAAVTPHGVGHRQRCGLKACGPRRVTQHAS